MSSMRAWCFLGSMLLVSQIHAQDVEPVPMLMRIASGVDLNAPDNSGLLGAWAFSKMNKEQAAKIDRFNTWLPQSNIETKARAAFACVQISLPRTVCRTENQMPRSESELLDTLKRGPGKTGLLVTLQPILVPQGFSLRVPVREIELVGDALVTRRTLTVLYANRVPRALEEQKGSNEQLFRDYWLANTPSRLQQAVDLGTREAASLLGALLTEVSATGQPPKAWSDLPKISTLVKTGRAKCRGMPCAAVRIYKDDSDGLWLVHVPGIMLSGPLLPDVGVALVSLDQNAALWQTSVWAWTFVGY